MDVDGMAAPSPQRVRPCHVCGGQCRAFPDTPAHDTYPLLTDTHKARPKDPKPGRPKGKRRPAEDRARHLQEDR